MGTPKTKILNVNKIHYHIYVSFVISNEGLLPIKNVSNFFQNINYLHVTPTIYKTIRYSATRTKKPLPKPQQLPLETHKQNLAEKFILKMG